MAAVTPLVVIVGETASGKSALGMALAAEFGGEIIAADSWTVYRGFDVGTAKPGPADRAAVAHHLLDIANPAEGYSAAVFKSAAQQVITDVAQRGKLPIMVGGTGLYIDSVLYDYSFLPKPSHELRESLNAYDIPELLQIADDRGLDLSGIDMNNKRRVIRLIENDGLVPSKHEIRSRTLVIGLSIPRDELDHRIEGRVDTMFAQGLAEEVRELSGRYGWDVEPMKGVGYREFKDFFAGTVSMDMVRENIIRNTKKLAKKQRTWFLRNQSIHWVQGVSEARTLVETLLADNHRTD